MAKIAVIGAGVIGLSSAYAIKLFDEKIDLTVFSEHFSPNTTSDGAAGVFKFSETGMRDTPKEILRRWASDSYNWLKENYKKERAVEMGISLASGYLLSDQETLNSDIWLSMVDHQWLTKKQLEEFGPNIRSGVFATSFMCECRKYLPWLLERLKEKDVKFMKKKISSFDELASYDVIVNCSGLGSVELCQDKEMQPHRGQVARVKAPWIRHWYHITYMNSEPSSLVYIYPNNESIVIGGTNDMSWNVWTSQETRSRIMEDTQKLMPSLKHAKFIQDWVGLRPSRSSVRLEIEDLVLKTGENDTTKQVKVVHNYGHGPSGVTLSWGCAQHTVSLVAKCLEEINCIGTIARL